MLVVDCEDIFPGLDRLTMLVLAFQHLRLAREERDSLSRIVGKLDLSLEVGEQMRPVLLLGANTGQRVDGRSIAWIGGHGCFVRRSGLGPIVKMLLVHLPKQERGACAYLGSARAPELQLEDVDQLVPCAAFAKLPGELLQ